MYIKCAARLAASAKIGRKNPQGCGTPWATTAGFVAHPAPHRFDHCPSYCVMPPEAKKFPRSLAWMEPRPGGDIHAHLPAFRASRVDPMTTLRDE